MYGEYTRDFGQKAVREWSRLAERPPAAVLIGVNIAGGFLVELDRQNCLVPEDFSVISYGQIEFSELFSTNLTYIDSMYHEIGGYAGKLMQKRLVEKDSMGERIVLKGKIIDGDSVRRVQQKSNGVKEVRV